MRNDGMGDEISREIWCIEWKDTPVSMAYGRLGYVHVETE